MIDAGIHPGDVLEIEHSREARHGQIVVIAAVERELTVLRGRPLGRRTVLKICTSDSVAILVIGGIRMSHIVDAESKSDTTFFRAVRC